MRENVFKTILVMSLLLLVLILPLANAQELTAEKEIYPFKKLEHKIEFGKTRELGGGSYLRLDLEAGSSLMVIWGESWNPGPVTIITRGIDVVGVKELANGSTSFINSETLFFYRLESIVEFQDLNGNGLYDRNTNNDTLSVSRGEPVEKGVSLSGIWKIRKDRPEVNENGLEWVFGLYAKNISYRSNQETTTGELNRTRPTPAMFLDEVGFTFHLKVTKQERTLRLEEYSAGDVSSTDEKSVRDRNSVVIDTSIKMGHKVVGWDFERDNRMPALMMRFSMKLGRTYDPLFLGEVKDTENARIYGNTRLIAFLDNTTGQNLWSDSSGMEKAGLVDTLKGGELKFGSDLKDLLKFFWKNEAFAERSDSRIKAGFQILGLRLIGPTDPIWNSPLLKGRPGMLISVTGGFTYPGTGSLTHDPGFTTTSMMVEVKMTDGNDDTDTSFLSRFNRTESISIIAILFVLLLLITVSIISTLSRRKYNVGDEELMREEEEEVFTVRTRKRDWNRLRPK